MTNEELAAIKARAEAATAGMWSVDEPFRNEVYIIDGNNRSVAFVNHNDDQRHEQAADAAFIAHSRTDIPALLAEVERLQAQLHEAKKLNDIAARMIGSVVTYQVA